MGSLTEFTLSIAKQVTTCLNRSGSFLCKPVDDSAISEVHDVITRFS